MAWCPKAIHKNIRPGSNDPPIDVVGAILHVAVSEGDSLYDFFKYRSGGIESHFYIRRDGTIEQYRNTGYEADANHKANSFWQDGRRKGFVSIETQGMGPGEWTPEQMASIKYLLGWLSETHDFPLRKTPGPFSAGVGYHTMHGAPSEWTPVSKSCPGPDRIKQFHGDIVPWMNNGGEITEMDVEKIVRTLLRTKIPMVGQTAVEKAERSVEFALAMAVNRAGHARQDAALALAQAEKNGRAIQAMAEGLDPAVREAVEKVLTEKIIVKFESEEENEPIS